MTVKAVDFVRKIRDKNYRETKDLSLAEQIRIVRKKAASSAFFLLGRLAAARLGFARRGGEGFQND